MTWKHLLNEPSVRVCLAARILSWKALATHRCSCVSALFELGCCPAQKQGEDHLCTIHTHRTKQTATQLSLPPVPPGEVSASDPCLSEKFIMFKCISRSFDMYQRLMVLQVFSEFSPFFLPRTSGKSEAGSEVISN